MSLSASLVVIGHLYDVENGDLTISRQFTKRHSATLEL